jgi:hypothetical protein
MDNTNNTGIFLLRAVFFLIYFAAIALAIFITQTGTPLWALILMNPVIHGIRVMFPRHGEVFVAEDDKNDE